MTLLDVLFHTPATGIFLSALALMVLVVASGPFRAYHHWERGRIVSAARVAQRSALGAYALLWLGSAFVLLHVTGFMVWSTS